MGRAGEGRGNSPKTMSTSIDRQNNEIYKRGNMKGGNQMMGDLAEAPSCLRGLSVDLAGQFGFEGLF